VSPEHPELYDTARRVSHDLGFAWTDPRTRITYPPPPCATSCRERGLVRTVERAEIDETDPVKHTAFVVLACASCRLVSIFPESNFALVTPRAKRQLHLELAALGWWLPWPSEQERRAALVAQAREDVQAGSGHDCEEWRDTPDRRCALCDRPADEREEPDGE
jgi:hypothetical protein